MTGFDFTKYYPEDGDTLEDFDYSASSGYDRDYYYGDNDFSVKSFMKYKDHIHSMAIATSTNEDKYATRISKALQDMGWTCVAKNISGHSITDGDKRYYIYTWLYPLKGKRNATIGPGIKITLKPVKGY